MDQLPGNERKVKLFKIFSQMDIRLRFETVLIVLANLSKQMRREHVEVKDVPELCTWIEMLLPTGKLLGLFI